MKFCLVGPGIMPIPPDGWGALERQMWDRACVLGEMGHEGEIINVPDMNQIVKECLEGNYDVIHVHYDVFYPVVDYLYGKVNCPILFSSHYPYIDQPHMHRRDGYDRILDFMMNNTEKFYNFAVSPKDYDFFLENNVPKNRLFWLMEGTNDPEFTYNETCEYPDKSIYLGKISERKKQYIYQSLSGIDFVGKYESGTSFNSQDSNYKGEWGREDLCRDLTKYANMVLLSDGENGTSLAIKEALVNGLGVVISKHSASELDTSKPYITIVSDDKMQDLDYIQKVIEENRECSVASRKDIREYGMETFSLTKLIDRYVKNIESILNAD
jgi:hypothetical protein